MGATACQSMADKRCAPSLLYMCSSRHPAGRGFSFFIINLSFFSGSFVQFFLTFRKRNGRMDYGMVYAAPVWVSQRFMITGVLAGVCVLRLMAFLFMTAEKGLALRTSDRCHWCGNPYDLRSSLKEPLRNGFPRRCAHRLGMT